MLHNTVNSVLLEHIPVLCQELHWATLSLIRYNRNMTLLAACAECESLGYRKRYLHSAVVNVATSVKRDLAYVFLKT